MKPVIKVPEPKFLQLVPTHSEAVGAVALEVVIRGDSIVRVSSGFRRTYADARDPRPRGARMLLSSTCIFVYAQPVYMRRSFDALRQCVRHVLKQDPESGALFIFAGKRGTSLKILWWDKPGCSIRYKRLTHGTFRLPAAVSGESSVAIDARELALILQGVEAPTRKQRVKALVKRAREKALRISESATTDPSA